MISICPTVTADNADDYNRQLLDGAKFSTRVHIDIADGQFAPRQLLPITNLWWPGSTRVDIHMMYKRPLDHLKTVIALGPQLVIVHAEADGNFLKMSKTLRSHGIEAGVALLPETEVDVIKPGLEYIDHVLIFSGNLGYQGGSRANLKLLDKVQQIKKLKPTIEIGWDGGANDTNLKQIIDAGVEVINIGSYLQESANLVTTWQNLYRIARDLG